LACHWDTGFNHRQLTLQTTDFDDSALLLYPAQQLQPILYIASPEKPIIKLCARGMGKITAYNIF